MSITCSAPTASIAASRTISYIRGIVDDTRIPANVVHLNLGPERPPDFRGDLNQAALQVIPDVTVERPHRSPQLGGIGDHVEGLTGQERRDRHHTGFDRISLAGDQGLQRGHDLGTDHDGIDRRLRSRGVPALALDPDRELVARRRARSLPQPDLPGREFGGDMQGQHRIDMGILQGAVPDHPDRAAGREFFGRLEEHLYRARELTLAVDQQSRQPQQHRGVGIVPTGVHHPGILRDVLDLVRLEDRQRIHIRANEHHAVLAWPSASAL